MYLLIGLLTFATLFSWTILISVFSNRISPDLVLKFRNGVYFCEHCNHVIGHRISGKEFINGRFVERGSQEFLPSNVILFKKNSD
jgi:hypothetical protein